MFRSLFSRRGGMALAVAALGVSGMSMAMAGTAGAAPNASLLIGSGSQTSYSTMTSLSDLFNGSPGCDLTAAASLPATLNCGTSPFSAGSTGGEQGFNVAAENPYNDFTVQAPAVGSGNGATQLETQSTHVDYARASSHKGNATTNDVAYATDGVSWTTFNKVGAAKTDQAKVVNITQSNLQLIWNGTLSCTGKGGVHLTMNWECLGAKASAPIDCYVAQSGSGTYSTWQGVLGFSNPAGCDTAANEAGDPGDTNVVADHENLFENQMSYIASRPDAKDAIYFMSFGKYTTTCPAGKCAGATSDLTTFGEINGVKATQSTVQGTGGGGGVTFPITRDLYNIYNNSTSSFPASQATLNLVSEYGFLCKASTATDIDPQTGVSYRTEIEADITSQGFFPLDVGGHTFAEGTVANPASITDAGYAANDPTTPTAGYCLLTVG